MIFVVDIFTPEKRSWIMSRIRSKDTKIEMKIAELLRGNNLRYRMHPKLFGSPDFVVGKNVLQPLARQHLLATKKTPARQCSPGPPAGDNEEGFDGK